MSNEAFTLTWDHIRGHVQIQLKSGTRISLGRDQRAFLWPFLDALHQLNQRDPEYLAGGMTEAQFRRIFARWKANANKLVDEWVAECEQTAKRLSQEQIDTMREEYLASGHVVIKPTTKAPQDLDLSDLLI